MKSGRRAHTQHKCWSHNAQSTPRAQCVCVCVSNDAPLTRRRVPCFCATPPSLSQEAHSLDALLTLHPGRKPTTGRRPGPVMLSVSRSQPSNSSLQRSPESNSPSADSMLLAATVHNCNAAATDLEMRATWAGCAQKGGRACGMHAPGAHCRSLGNGRLTSASFSDRRME